MIGIDKPIEALRKLFEDNLWISNDAVFYGRCFRNERNNKLIPEAFINDEYEEVLLQDFNDATVFFDVENDREALRPGSSQIIAKVNIYFAVNLKNLYPSIATERATEYAHRDAIKYIDASSFNHTGIRSGFESYDTWDYDKAAIDNMQPYYLFRINTEVVYTLNC
jgi:hypothetical protein